MVNGKSRYMYFIYHLPLKNVINRFGLLGVPVEELSLQRLLGVTFITIGVILIRNFKKAKARACLYG